MNRSVFNPLKVLLAVIGFIFLYNPATAQTVSPLWASNTFSSGIGDTSGVKYSSLAYTVTLTNPEETESFNLFLNDEKDQTVKNAGEYIVKKHENGFYYVEEKSSHERITVFGNTLYFSTAIQDDKAAAIKSVSLKVRSKSKDQTGPGIEKTVKTKVAKFKKKR